MMELCIYQDCSSKQARRAVCREHYKAVAEAGFLHELPDPPARRSVPSDTLSDRFWSRVEKTDYCWTWSGSLTSEGYGRIRSVLGVEYAHRVSWELNAGPIAEGNVIDHLCYNRACVNPAHLRQCSHAENLQNPSGLAAANTSGHRNVSWHAAKGQWMVQVRAFGERYYGGMFRNLSDAADAAAKLREELHDIPSIRL